MKKNSVQIFLGLGLVFFAGSVLAQRTTPKAVIEEIVEKVRLQEVSKNSALQEKVNRHIDFHQMAERALGKHSANLKSEDKKWFESTLKKLITKSVYRSAPDFLKGVRVNYVDEDVEETQASITSEVMKKAETTEVRYSLKKVAGNWQVVDVAIDDESWVDNIRDEIEEVMVSKKWEGLKKKMSDRLQELDKKPAKVVK